MLASNSVRKDLAPSPRPLPWKPHPFIHFFDWLPHLPVGNEQLTVTISGHALKSVRPPRRALSPTPPSSAAPRNRFDFQARDRQPYQNPRIVQNRRRPRRPPYNSRIRRRPRRRARHHPHARRRSRHGPSPPRHRRGRHPQGPPLRPCHGALPACPPPSNTRRLDRTKEPGTPANRYQDVITAPPSRSPKVRCPRGHARHRRRYTSSAGRPSTSPRRRRITSSASTRTCHSSLEYDNAFSETKQTVRCHSKNGKIGANKNNVKIIGEETDTFRATSSTTQSGSITTTCAGPHPIRHLPHLRANFIAYTSSPSCASTC